jgi:hypothetical protein
LQSIREEEKEEKREQEQQRQLPQERQSQKRSHYQSPALNSFIYALKSPESQKQYPGRLKKFFDFLGLTKC